MSTRVFNLSRLGAFKGIGEPKGTEGAKTAEVRLGSHSNLEIKTGDIITFIHNGEMKDVKVTRVDKYNSFHDALDKNYFQRP